MKSIDIAIKAALSGGKILNNFYCKKIKITHKKEIIDASSVVTEADFLSEIEIIKVLKLFTPDHNFYCEEQNFQNNNSAYTWCIDPLDGTSNFINQIPLWGISIGLIEEEEPILGILYFPLTDILIYAEKNKGAYSNQINKKLQVSTKNLQNSLYLAGGIYSGEHQVSFELMNKVAYTKIFDCSCFELAQIASGNAEVYIRRNSLHDVAASICIISESGGMVTDYKGKPWNPKSKGVVITNGYIHRNVIEIISATDFVF